MKKIVPIVPRGSGNSRQIPCSKHWCFTLNNSSSIEFNEILTINSSIVPRYVFQSEIGESGTQHLQGYMCFAKKCRPISVFKTNRIHWEKTRSIRKSIAYCQKKEGRIDGPWYRGIDPPYTIEISEWKGWMIRIKNILTAEPHFRKIYWYWERRGNIGKTLISKWIFLNMERVCIISGKGADMKNCIVKYLDTNKVLPKIILINVPRSREGFISWSGIEEVKDMFFYSGKYEGGMICGPNPHVIIMANYPPEYRMLSEDRWVVEEVA